MKLLSLMFSIASLLFLTSCGGLDLPSVEESKLKIDQFTIGYVDLKKEIAMKIGDKKQSEDVTIQVKTSALNMLLDKFAFSTTNDIKLNILQTNEIYAENKSTFGISYKNYANIDNGNIDLDLKKIRLESNDNNRLIGLIELEGKGRVKVSGKYLGVPVNAEPEIQLYLNDQFNFETKSIGGKLFLALERKNVLLKSKISIKLLEWSIPYYKEIPLDAAEIIKPIELPMTTQSDILFPMPASKFGASKVEFIPLKIELNNLNLTTNKEYLKIKTNLNFIKKY